MSTTALSSSRESRLLAEIQARTGLSRNRKKIQSGSTSATGVGQTSHLQSISNAKTLAYDTDAVHPDETVTNNVFQVDGSLNAAIEGLKAMGDALLELREVAVTRATSQSLNMTTAQLSDLSERASNAIATINSLAETTSYFGQELLDGSYDQDREFQTHADDDFTKTKLEVERVFSQTLGLDHINVDSTAQATRSLDDIDKAIGRVSSQLARLGDDHHEIHPKKMNQLFEEIPQRALTALSPGILANQGQFTDDRPLNSTRVALSYTSSAPQARKASISVKI